MLAWIGDIFKGLGTSIMENIVTPLGDALSGAFGEGGFIQTFATNIGTAVKDGFGWVQEKVGGLFGAKDAAEYSDAFGKATDFSAVPSADGWGEQAWGVVQSVTGQDAVKSAVSEATTSASSAVQDSASGGLMSEAAPKAATAEVATDIVESAQPAGLNNLFDNMTDFFSKPVNQFLGKGALALIGNKIEQKAAEKVAKAQAREARRQEEERRQRWMIQQNYQAELGQWQAERDNEERLGDAQNKFAGLSGRYIQPRTNVPRPTL